MSKTLDCKQEAIVLCCEVISNTAMKLGLAEYRLKHNRTADRIAQLERINELKARLYNLENCLEDLYNDLNEANVEFEDGYYERANEALIGANG